MDLRRSVDPLDEFVREHYQRIKLIRSESMIGVYELGSSSAGRVAMLFHMEWNQELRGR